eukprot:3179541-Alexandrium_andersonii.AAC.1
MALANESTSSWNDHRGTAAKAHSSSRHLWARLELPRAALRQFRAVFGASGTLSTLRTPPLPQRGPPSMSESSRAN